MTRHRLETLDALRGIAALIVVLYHFTTRYYEIYDVKKTFDFALSFGHYGVDIFFIISGFVIYLTLSNTKSSTDFIVNRFSRLFPTYWLCVTLSYVIITIFSLPGRETSSYEYLINLSMIHLEFHIPSVDGVYWTLLYELKFYFLMLIIFHFNLLHKINALSFFMLVLILILNLVNLHEHVVYKILNKIFIFDFLPLFISGIMFYKIMHKEVNTLVVINLLLSFYILASPKDFTTLLTFTLIYLLFLFLVFNKLNFLNNKVLIFLGTISYPLYLIHQNIGYIILNAFNIYHLPLVYGTITAIIVAISLASLISYMFEKPSIRFLKSYYKKRKAQTV